MNPGTRQLGVYSPDSSQVSVEGITYDIVAENEDFIALFRRGRSVYTPGVGATYEPARIFFCTLADRLPIPDSRESSVYLNVLLAAPIRRS